MRKKVSSIVLNVFLLLLGIVTVYPFIWMLCSSFKQNKEIMALQQHLLPQEFTIDNYISMNSHFNFMRFFGNSLFITIVVTLLVVYTSTICGFVLSKYKFKGRNILFGFVLATMMIPWCVTIIPKYTMIQKFGWMDMVQDWAAVSWTVETLTGQNIQINIQDSARQMTAITVSFIQNVLVSAGHILQKRLHSL